MSHFGLKKTRDKSRKRYVLRRIDISHIDVIVEITMKSLLKINDPS